ncbi:MAG: 16S rRNA processing protein RimM, partial [Acidobacteria bacterium]
DLLTDFPERFEGIEQLICIDTSGKRSNLELEDYWFHRDRVVFKFAGVEDPDAAQRYVGSDFGVPESERVRLPKGQFYDWELEGCSVSTVTGEQIGSVREIMRTGAVDTLVIEDSDQHDYLVPLTDAIVTRVDVSKKTILIDPPEGLLDL